MATWKIVNMERDAATGFVSVAHWTCSAVDGDFSGSTYGSIGLTGELITPYEALTEEGVIGWVKEALGAEIETLKARVSALEAA